MHVATNRSKILVPAPIYDQRFVTSTKQMPTIAVAPIETRSVGSQEPFHACNQVGFRCLNDQVKMIRHQAIGMNFPIRSLTHFPQGLHKFPSVVIIQKDWLLPTPSNNDVVDRTFVFNPQFPSPVS